MEKDEEYELDKIVRRFSKLVSESFDISREPPVLSDPMPVSPRSPFSPLPPIPPFSPLSVSATPAKPSPPPTEETVLSSEYLVDAVDIFTASAGILQQEMDKNVTDLITKEIESRRSLADSKSPRGMGVMSPASISNVKAGMTSPVESLGAASTVSSTTRLQQLDGYVTDLQKEDVVRDGNWVSTLTRLLDVINMISDEIKDKKPAPGASRFSVEFSAEEIKNLRDISNKLIAERNRRIVLLTMEAGLLGAASNLALSDTRRNLLLDVLATFRDNDQLARFGAFIKIAGDRPFDMSGAGQLFEDSPRIDSLRSTQVARAPSNVGDVTIEYALARFVVNACRDNDPLRFEAAITLLKQLQYGRQPEKFTDVKKLGTDYSIAADRLRALYLEKNIRLAHLRVEQALLGAVIEFQEKPAKSKAAYSLIKAFRTEKRPDIFSRFLEEAKTREKIRKS